MFKRDTRVQIVILENNRYILLKHLYKPTNLTFWGFPGGGREENESEEEAAIREAREETNLDVELLPFKIELEPLHVKVYRRIVTFLAYPIFGVASKGYEPEEETMTNYEYELLELKWQDLYDEDIDDITRQSILPIRDYIENNSLKKRVGTIIYKIQGNQLFYLLEKANDCYTIPTVNIKMDNSASLQNIEHELNKRMNFKIQIEKNVGFYFSEIDGNYNQIFVYLSNTSLIDKVKGDWFSLQEIEGLNLQRQIHLFIQGIEEEKSK